MAKIFLLILIFFHYCFLAIGQKTNEEIEVRVLSDLSFGSFVTGTTGGTVIISPEGTQSVTGSVISLALSPVSAAEFEVTTQGRPWIQFEIVEPAFLYQSGEGEPLEITNFTTNIPVNPFRATGGNKPDIVRVGATLYVKDPNSNPPGNYSGNFTVTFHHQ